MAWIKRESPYERRLRELDEEAERVRKSMQQLMRQVPQGGTPTRTSPGSGPAPGYRRAVDPRAAVPAPLTPPTDLARVVDEEIDDESLLSYQPVSSLDADPVADTSMSRTTRAMPHLNRPGSAAGGPVRPERLANYLASGSFGKSRPLSHERRIERNKAIMMLLFALLALFTFITWMN